MALNKILIFVLPLALSLKCPIFTCDDWVTDTCLYESFNVLVHSNCSDPSMTCPIFNKYTNSSVKCVKTTSSTRPSFEPQCVDYKSLNEQLTQGSFCKPGFMPNSLNICVQAPKEFEPCTTHCDTGFVCNNSLCIKYFSIPSGHKADNPLACESGLLKNFTCQDEQKSKIEFQTCRVNRDCQSTNSEQFSECKCVRNENPRSYCTLHPSDSLVIEAKKASSDGDIHRSRLLWHRVLNYPYLDLSTNCMASSSEEHLKLEKYLKEIETCFASLSSSLGFLLVLVLGF